MKNEPVDLSALAARSDPVRWAAWMAQTLEGADAVLERRAAEATPFDYLLLWSRPAMMAAVVVIMTSMALFARESAAIRVQNGAQGLAEIARVWASGGPLPTGQALDDVVEKARR
jgi:hypothetical protein